MNSSARRYAPSSNNAGRGRSFQALRWISVSNALCVQSVRGVAHRLLLAADAERDLLGIADFLVEAHVAFGLSEDEALDKAEARVLAIRQDLDRLSATPHRGTRHDDLLPGLRHVTLERAIVWFDVDEDARTVRVLAVFWDGADHQRRMLTRLLKGAS